VTSRASAEDVVSDAKIRWKGPFALKDVKAREIRLRFELREAKLFSFSFED